MLKPPSVKHFAEYPLTVSVSLAALAVTGAWWSGWNIEQIATTDEVWEKWQLWRALTSTLPHADVFHLAFNLYWFWTFGTLVEKVYGHVKFAAIILLLALGSSLAEFALLEGGVGLSGVGYGLWSMLWLLEKRDPRFRDAVDSKTTITFVVWFFLCVALTVTNAMPIANIAHAVGAGLGVLVGLAASSNGLSRARSIAAIGAVILFWIAASTSFWPWINLSPYAQSTVERAGVEALLKSQNQRAVKLLETASKMRHAPAHAWYNLGIAYQHLERYSDASAAYQRAATMADATPDIRAAAKDFQDWQKDYLQWLALAVTNSK